MENEKKPKVNRFKLWCIENGIKQVELKEKTRLAIGTLHKMMNESIATDKTIKLVAISLREDFGMSVSEEELSGMLC